MFPSPSQLQKGAYSLDRSQVESLLFLSQYLRSKFDWIVLYLHPNCNVGTLLKQNGWIVQQRYTYYLSLHDLERLYQQFDGTLKRQIKKGQRGQFVIKDNFVEPSLIYNLWKKTMKRQKVNPPLTLQAFSYIYKKLQRNSMIRTFSAYNKDGNLAAIVIFLINHKLAYYWLSTLNIDFANTGINQLLLWKGLQHIAQQGIEKLDFVGADIPSIAAYKKRFGGELIPHSLLINICSPRAKIVRASKKLYKNFLTRRND
jgi:lipid II:glycine glycyltransferase (peptidoglycan interpeptide bridge formation enzyme)